MLIIIGINMKTLVAIPNSQVSMPTSFVNSLLAMNLPNSDIKIFRSFPPTRNRNETIKYFLEHDYQELLWIDSDMIHPIDLLVRLQSRQKDIVSALYFQRNYPFYPIMFMENETEKGSTYQMFFSWKKELIKVDSIGTGCVLIQRKVFESLSFPFCEYTRSSIKEDAYIGEDTYLFKKCKEAGFDLWVDATLESRHLIENSVGENEAVYALRTHLNNMNRLQSLEVNNGD